MADERQIFLSVGDDYDIVGYPPNTPCSVKGELFSLEQVQAKGIQGDFKVHIGRGCWVEASLSRTKELQLTFHFFGEGPEFPTKSDFRELLYNLLVDPKFRARNGIKWIKIT